MKVCAVIPDRSPYIKGSVTLPTFIPPLEGPLSKTRAGRLSALALRQHCDNGWSLLRLNTCNRQRKGSDRRTSKQVSANNGRKMLNKK